MIKKGIIPKTIIKSNSNINKSSNSIVIESKPELFKPIILDIDDNEDNEIDESDYESDDDIILPPNIFLYYAKNIERRFFRKWLKYYLDIKKIKRKKELQLEKIERKKENEAIKFFSKRAKKNIFNEWKKIV